MNVIFDIGHIPNMIDINEVVRILIMPCVIFVCGVILTLKGKWFVKQREDDDDEDHLTV